MNYKIKMIFTIITILLDIFLLIILLKTNDLSIFDIFVILFFLKCHIFFYIAIWTSDRPLIDILHVTIFISMFFGFFIENVYLLSLILFFSIGLQFQWIILNKCLLNTEKQNEKNTYGYSVLTSCITILHSTFISYKLGRKIKN